MELKDPVHDERQRGRRGRSEISLPGFRYFHLNPEGGVRARITGMADRKEGRERKREGHEKRRSWMEDEPRQLVNKGPDRQ